MKYVLNSIGDTCRPKFFMSHLLKNPFFYLKIKKIWIVYTQITVNLTGATAILKSQYFGWVVVDRQWAQCDCFLSVSRSFDDNGKCVVICSFKALSSVSLLQSITCDWVELSAVYYWYAVRLCCPIRYKDI